MTTAFPAICPTSRTFTPGDYAAKRFTAINGAGTTRLYGSKPFDSTLQLQFLLNDSDLQSLLSCWNDAYGTYGTLDLPENVLVGVSGDVQNEIASSLNWRWAERPSVQSVLPGRSRVTVNLVATLDV